MRKNAFNIGLFLMLAGGMLGLLWYGDQQGWFPKPEAKKKADEPPGDDPQKQAEEEAKRLAALNHKRSLEAVGGGLAVAIDLPKPATKSPEPPKTEPKTEPKTDTKVAPSPPSPTPPTLIALGDDRFYNKVLLSTRGGGVQQVVLPWFDQADRLGRGVYLKDEDGNPTKTPVPYYLIPGVPQPRGAKLREEYQVPTIGPGLVKDASVLVEPSYTIFHYPTPDDKYPDPRLGEINWNVVAEERPDDGPHRVVFETELGEPYYVKIRKTYTLAPKEYHVGLKIEIEKLKVAGASKGKGQLRLQLSGPRGLPIEGEWYTSLYRVAIVGWLDRKDTPRRQYEDAATVSAKRGGELVPRGKDDKFKYMAVATQYFASGIAIDDEAQAKGAVAQPWAYVRATTELPFDKKQDPNLPSFDDITVRAASETLDLAPGETVTQSYLIYNGPSKVRLLGLMSGDRAVDPELVERYKGKLGLQTITDFRSDNWLGRFANAIYWTDLVIACTNLMHWFLALIHYVIPSWALAIVMLTITVRLLLLIPSKKQTQMSMKLMEVQKKLQPEFEKLYEKHKDDLHTYNREKTKLMMQNGANPFAAMGGCLLLLAQMPIMMGLYFCLQESVFFRLQDFLWIDNLAAPDMMFWWSEGIPYISTPEDIGSFVYLGPYFNLLPLLAVGLMLYQQAKMMPPSTDPQAEQTRMMMKIMMIMMAIFFYKVAAGLALYFIVSTLWAIIERLFVHKPNEKKPGEDGEGTTAEAHPKTGSPNGKAPVATANNPTAAAAVADAQKKSKGLFTRLREALQKKLEEMQKRADEQSKRQIRNEPNPYKQEPIRNPERPNPEQRKNDRRDKKKKRKK
ncbi:MAG: YidC/Oxa1 family insertase periplasmic-domain containing protein [Planctomycetia bacterium]|nr:YidC/Oxa1 family insertase periplasmic-domain containing protein [Planctomycetia bacterium]